MQILHFDLKRVAGDDVKLRFFEKNPYESEPHTFSFKEITDLNEIAERDYYTGTRKPEENEEIRKRNKEFGKLLYNFLDRGSHQQLTKLLKKYRRNEGVILAIAAAKNLANLPWELLHDEKEFLVQRAVVPIRWMPPDPDDVNKLFIDNKRKNRPLQVLFMASSPRGELELDYEEEEARILKATKGRPQNVTLRVEESGILSELGGLINAYDNGHFDVLHLTGHATFKEGKPRFIAETETGEADYVSASDIAKELQFKPVKLIFLSGCHTARKSDLSAEISMAEELVESGVQAVLGWGYKVLDTDAILAAEVLYKALSEGKQVTEAVAQTYQTLLKNNARDWDLLRLYTANKLPGKLVTPLEYKGRKPAPEPSFTNRFLDAKGQRKVPTRESFIGRRRQLQKCLQSLISKTGVLIHGMGGLGKSSIAARLCDRRPNYERIVWVGKVNQQDLVDELLKNQILQKSKFKSLLKELRNSQKELKFRLQQVFNKLKNNGEKFLFVLDDFEENLDPGDHGYVLKPYAAEVLNAIVWAIEDTYSSHRIIITCRYDFDFNKQWKNFYKQPLNAMRGTELQKMCNRLAVFKDQSQENETWPSKMKKLADGNPRLLVFLNDELQKPSIDKDDILNRWEAEPKKLQDEVLKNELKKYLLPRIREMLQRGLIFDLPVPKQALVEICETIGHQNIEQDINQAKALGFLEVSPDDSLRVPRILDIEKLCKTDLYRQAAKILYPLWVQPKENSKDISEEHSLEIFRLAQLGNETEITLRMTEILANRWLEQSRFQEAVKLCTQTLERLKDIYNDLPKNQIARIKSILASSYTRLEYYEKAKLQYNEVKDILTKTSTESLDLAQTLDGLGHLYSLVEDFDKAKQMLVQALNIRQKIEKEHLDTVRILSHLAYLHRIQKHWKEAGLLYAQALRMCKRISAKENINLAEIYHKLGNFYYQQEKYKKAEGWYSRSLKINEKLLGEDHLNVAITSSCLAKVYLSNQLEYLLAKDQGKYEHTFKKAKQLFNKALNIKKRLLGEHLAIVDGMKNLGYVSYILRQDKEAEDWHRQALEMIKVLIDKRDPSVEKNQSELVQEIDGIVSSLILIYQRLDKDCESVKRREQEIIDSKNQNIPLERISEISQALLDLIH
ncbi:MAG: tetratricopeptide repeat protein [Nostoc sp. DedQUE01]|nr:tetratricopeptide repeat protein [Nostoc sp. DedQUE01]